MRKYSFNGKIGAFCLVYFGTSLAVYAVTEKLVHLAMAWNVLLAAMPLVFILLTRRFADRNRRLPALLMAALWLLFFPNAPYLTTDFIHMNQMDFYTGSPFTRDFRAWLSLVHIGLGVFLGSVVGFYSFDLARNLAAKFLGKRITCVFVTVVCLLSGYAIYIGRFLRLNSWDILRPFHLAAVLLRNIDRFAVSYSLLFAVCTLCEYLLFWLFFRPEHSLMERNGDQL